MILLVWAVLGLAVGAVGTEILRVTKPRLVKKVEDAAKRFADSVCPAERSDEQTDKGPDNNDPAA
jgi:hypothetical protein